MAKDGLKRNKTINYFFNHLNYTIMPNYIKNKIELIGSPKQVAQLVEKFSTAFEKEANKSLDGNLIYENKETKEFGWLDEKTNIFTQRDKENKVGVPAGFEQDFNEAWTRFPDFNKVVPMPESLNITSGSLGDMAHQLLFGTKKQKFFPIDNTEQQRRFSEMDIERQKEAVDLAIKYQDNIVKYGHPTWYDWSYEHWGTKWNSSSCEKLSDNVYVFTTAWSGVPTLMEKMSAEFPEIKILYKYADEDSGSNTGSLVIQNGETLEFTKPESQSKEGYELYFELHPDSVNNYKLVGDKYEYVDEES